MASKIRLPTEDEIRQYCQGNWTTGEFVEAIGYGQSDYVQDWPNKAFVSVYGVIGRVVFENEACTSSRTYAVKFFAYTPGGLTSWTMSSIIRELSPAEAIALLITVAEQEQ